MYDSGVVTELVKIIEEVKKAAAESGAHVPDTPDLLPPSAMELSITELGLDSLSAAALMTEVEDRFSIVLPPMLLLECSRIGDFVRAIEKEVSARDAC